MAPDIYDVERRGDDLALDDASAVKKKIHNGNIVELADVKISHA